MGDTLKRYTQKEIGRCDFIDVLEESVTTHRKVDVELAGGRTFTTHIVNVVTHDGDDFAVLADGAEVPVGSVHTVTQHV